jgi:hypothetical protein
VSDDDQHECSKKERFLFDLSADFRDQMVTSVRNFSGSKNNGLCHKLLLRALPVRDALHLEQSTRWLPCPAK